MKTIRAITTAILIWILGVGIFISYFSVPLMQDPEFQANLTLALAMIPLAWFGAKFYYKKDQSLHGIKLGTIMVSIAILLDALITVPFLMIPQGGSYQEFFGSLSFWIIVLEYFSVVTIYWVVNIRPSTKSIIQ